MEKLNGLEFQSISDVSDKQSTNNYQLSDEWINNWNPTECWTCQTECSSPSAKSASQSVSLCWKRCGLTDSTATVLVKTLNSWTAEMWWRRVKPGVTRGWRECWICSWLPPPPLLKFNKLPRLLVFNKRVRAARSRINKNSHSRDAAWGKSWLDFERSAASDQYSYI